VSDPKPVVVPVVEWQREPIGAAISRALDLAFSRQISGQVQPNPIGWGAAGSTAETDLGYIASPQAFAAASDASMSTLRMGAVDPVDAPSSDVSDGLELPNDPNLW